MKNYTKLSMAAVVALMFVTGASLSASECETSPEECEDTLIAEEVEEVVDLGDHGLHQYLPEEEVAEEGEIGTDGIESPIYTRYGYAAYTGSQGVSIGQYAGRYDSTYAGTYNTNIGGRAGYNNKYGDHNVYMGYGAGYSYSSYGSSNVAIGYLSRYNLGGSYNVTIGREAGRFNNGHYNTQLGYGAGYSATSTDRSVMLGYKSGYDADNADYSVFIGYLAGYYKDRANTLMIENSSSNTPLIYGEFDNNLVRVNGTFETKWVGSDTSNFHRLVTLDALNYGAGESNVGFSLKDSEAGYEWVFRTNALSKGFSASKVGTGGNEFEVQNTGATNLNATVVKMGGVTVFKNGSLVDGSGTPLALIVQKQNTLLADTRAELKAAQTKIAQLETMNLRIAQLESLLTNLALDTSNSKTEKVTLNSK